MTQAKQFIEKMASVANDYEKSNTVAAKFEFKVVKFAKHNNRKGLRFADGSKLFFGDKEGILELPVN